MVVGFANRIERRSLLSDITHHPFYGVLWARPANIISDGDCSQDMQRATTNTLPHGVLVRSLIHLEHMA